MALPTPNKKSLSGSALPLSSLYPGFAVVKAISILSTIFQAACRLRYESLQAKHATRVPLFRGSATVKAMCAIANVEIKAFFNWRRRPFLPLESGLRRCECSSYLKPFPSQSVTCFQAEPATDKACNKIIFHQTPHKSKHGLTRTLTLLATRLTHDPLQTGLVYGRTCPIERFLQIKATHYKYRL